MLAIEGARLRAERRAAPAVYWAQWLRSVRIDDCHRAASSALPFTWAAPVPLRLGGLGAGGGTRTPITLRSTDFLTSYGFRRRPIGRLWSGLSLHRAPCRRLGAARLVSTPSRCRAWLGIAILQDSPNLSSSAPPVSWRALQFGLSPLRLPISPRPQSRGDYTAPGNRRQGRYSPVGSASGRRLWCAGGLADVDGLGVKHVLDVGGIVLLDDLDAGPEVLLAIW